MNVRLFVCVSSLALGVATDASAYENRDFKKERESEIIVVTANRKATELNKMPATISVMTDEVIEENLTTDIRDLVKYEPGVSVRRQPARFSVGSSIGRMGNEGFVIRGIGGNRVLTQVDGIRIPDGYSLGPYQVGRGDYVDVGMVKSVEILRGPNSAIYGSDALAGSVSYITSNPTDFVSEQNKFGGLVRGAYNSSDGELSETAVLAGRAGRLSGMLAFTHRDFSELENMGNIGGNGSLRTIANPQDGNSNALMGRIVFDINDNNRLRFTAERLENLMDSEVLSNISATTESFRTRDTGDRTRFSLDLSSKYNSIIRSAHYTIFWQDSSDEQFTDEDRTPSSDRERLNIFENEIYGLSTDFNAEIGNHEIIFGGDYSATKQTGIRTGVTPPFGETYPTKAFPDTECILAGLFIADEISFGNFTINSAVRYDFYEIKPEGKIPNISINPAAQDGSQFSPKIGVIWRSSDSVSIFANWGQGYKSPSPSQVNEFFENAAQGYSSVPNPDLKPETNESYEIGLRYSAPSIKASLSAFIANYDNFIDQVCLNNCSPLSGAGLITYQYQNLYKVEVSGFEGSAEWSIASGLKVKTAFSYAEGEQVNANGIAIPLETIDPLKIIFGLNYRDSEGRYGAELSASYNQRKSSSEVTCSPSCYRPKASTIVDLTAFYRVAENSTLRVGIMNLADEKYSYWNDVRGLSTTSSVLDAYTQPGRNYAISFTQRF